MCLLLLLMTDFPVQPTDAQIARYAKRGTTVVETDVPEYTLPAIPLRDNGTLDREAIVETLRREMFGIVPDLSVAASVSDGEPVTLADGTQAVHHVVTLVVSGDAGETTISPHLFRPAGDGPFPCFVLNDHRNQTDATPDNGPEAEGYWPVAQIIAAGYATAAVRVEEVAPDAKTADYTTCIHGCVSGDRAPNWGTLAAWAWAMSQTRAAVQTLPQIGPCIAIGHSRSGKTALWAGATDTAFAGVISNNSGCGGAALSRRRFGETVRIINTNFPHWFNARFKTYNDRESELPFDQHWVIAASRDRHVAVGSAREDVWADPKGEYLALLAAAKRQPSDEMEATIERGEQLQIVASPGGSLSYQIRPGDHGLTADDWATYLKWAGRFIK